MKRKFSLVFVLLVMVITAVHSQNHMDLIMTLTGEYVGSEYGTSVVSMDFNGDGYDDLIVKAALWHPECQVGDYQRMYGKIYFYWGGPDLSDQPDFVIEGQHPLHFSGYTYTSLQNHMINAGDMNGDGIDDLVIPEQLADGTRTVSVYFGRAIPQTEPDIELYYPQPDTRGIFVYPLGDINGDGKDDISIMLIPGHTVPAASILIWTDVFDNPVLFRTSTAFTDLCGVGDVNGDGFADIVHYNQVGEERSFSFYYGNETCSMADSLLIGTSSEPVDRYASPIGDVNGDGIPDFVSWKNKIWLGDSVIDSEPDIAIDIAPWLSFSYGMWPHIVHGDFNGDGYDDFAASDNHYAGSSGQAAIWLGSPNMNGTRDLALNPPDSYSYRNFGWSKAAGDFNGDGYCDLAFSAPIWTEGHTWYTAGKVFIYAGNAELTDTTVSNEDDTIPSINESSMWDISLSPNPVSIKDQDIKIHFTGSGFKELQNAKIEIFNLRGQMISDYTVDRASLANGQYSAKLQKLNSGVYFLRVSRQGGSFATHRFIVK